MGLSLFGKGKQPDATGPILKPEPGQQMVVFAEVGMHCTGCQGAIDRKLKTVAGAERISVDLAAQTATVIFDPAHTSAAALRAAIKEAGYTPKSKSVIAG